MMKSGPKYRCLEHGASAADKKDLLPQGNVASAASSTVPKHIHIPGIPYPITQYAPSVYASSPCEKYNPGTDCDGYFMSSKYARNNNCYNYAVNIASNSFAQPGRKHGKQPVDVDMSSLERAGPKFVELAEYDGLEYVGKTLDDIRQHATAGKKGHYVALLVSLKDETAQWINYDIVSNFLCGYVVAKTFRDYWRGDIHWVRCDDNVNFETWSQKDGGDQVTDFDFTGQTIVDPSKSNWTVNGFGDFVVSDTEYAVAYQFFAFMFVPFGKVDIL